MPHKLVTGTKPPVYNPRILSCPHVGQKATAYIGGRELNMRHQPQKGFRGILVGIPQHQKGYLIYIPTTRNIASSNDVVFDKTFPIALAYTSHTPLHGVRVKPDILISIHGSAPGFFPHF